MTPFCTSILKKHFVGVVSTLALFTSAYTVAVQAEVKDFSIQSQSLAIALNRFSEQANLVVVAPAELVQDKQAPLVNGAMEPEKALQMLLAGTSLNYRRDRSGTFIISQSTAGNGGVVSDKILEKEQKNHRQLEEVIVTAEKREKSLQDTAMAVSVVTPLDFTESGLTHLEDIIGYTPGFTFKNTGGEPGSGGAISARGIADLGGNVPGVVAVYIDDVPLTSASSLSSSSTFVFDGLLGDVERVELLKGPQGTIYGATAVGGALKYVTRKPSLDEMRAYGSMDLSSTQQGGFNKIYSGQLSTPIVQERLAVTLAGFYEDNAGFVDRVDSVGNVLEEDVDNFDKYGFSADILYQATEKLEFRGRLLRQKSDYTGLSIVNLSPATQQPVFSHFSNTRSPFIRSIENKIYAGTISYQFEWAEFVSSTSYIEDSRYIELDIPSLTSLIDVIDGNPPGTTTSAPLLADSFGEKFVQEVRLTSKIDGPVEWLMGLYYANEKSGFPQSLIGLPTNFVWSIIDSKSNYKEVAAFGNVTWYVTSDFDLTVGARLSDSTFDTKVLSVGFTGTDPVDESLKATVDTWLFAARYRPSEELSLYLRVASGYRPDRSVVPVFEPMNGTFSNPLVGSDSLWSYEVGAKGKFLDGRFVYDVALWSIDWTNMQVPFLTSLGQGSTTNLPGGATAEGVEGTLSFFPTDQLTIQSGFSYADSTFNRDEPLLGALQGQRLPLLPDWQAFVKARYSFTIGEATDAFWDIGVRYEGVTPNSSLNALSIIEMDDHAIVDLSAGCKVNDIWINIYTTNLLNEYAFASLDNSGSLGVPVRPRTIGVNIGYQF